MGIPKFYRWLSERYPLLNQPLTATEAPPQFDNLYLDMNGIIHNCTHGNDPNMKLTEEEMILRIYAYLDKLIQIIKPQNLVFMAIDGVAPRAKMNQQRSRRFKTGMERIKAKEEEDAKAIREGRPVDTTEAFDSNCITPGTGFMARLGEHLRFFVRKKIADDVTWQKPKVIFSGHDVPGEGEHKIMEYIRLEQRSGELAANSRHVMYGLDADLIMLSLVTHQPHFCLLREVVSYSGRNRGQPTREALDNPSAEHFVLFQIGLLREYLEMEFAALKLPFALDVECVIDDFVLFCMLVGNDFLPALPTLDISEGALNKLIDLYKELLPGMGGYLTHAGALDRGRLEQLLAALAQLELKTLQDRADDAEYFERKKGGRGGRGGGGGPPGNGIPVPGPPPANGAAREVALEALEPEEEPAAAAAVSAAPTMMSAEARRLIQGADGIELWKERYYADKLEVKGAAARRGVVEEYVRGLHWVLEYYYRGVASWNWYYPYHYAPMASDLVALDSVQVVFSQGKPFRPFEQLLSVLPASSSKHLPEPFRWLMSDPASPILDFYPTDFPVDMEGKRADWEGVAKICFVDEARLLAAAKSVRPEQLTAEERQRNEPGPILLFQASRTPTNETEFCTATLPHKFSSVLHCNSRCRKLPPPPPLPAGQAGFQPVLQPGTTTGLAAPAGFPTLKTMAVTGEMRAAAVNVFGQPSKKESYIVSLKDLRSALGQPPPARSVAGSVVGERCYVNWPYLKEAAVVAVSDPRERVTAAGPAAHSPEAAKEWACSAGALANTFLTKQGIDVGKCDLLLHVKDCVGYVRHIDDTIEKQFAATESVYPLQAVLRRHPAHAALPPGEAPGEPTVPLEEGGKVVFLGRTHYGCVGTLLADPGAGLAKDGHRVPAMRAGHRWRVQLHLPHPAAAELGVLARRAVRGNTVRYAPSGEVARKLGVSSRALGRITSNLWISDGDQRWDVGLAVKHAAQELCVPGYAVPAPGGAGWHYSPALGKVVAAYRAAHPWVIAMLDSGQDAGTYRLEAALPDATPEERRTKVEAVQRWLKAQPLAKLRLVKADSKVVADDAVRVMVANLPPAAHAGATCDMENVPPVLLLPPAHAGTPQSALVGKEVDLGDRVVCVKPAGGPPFGARGTVIAVYEDSAEVLMDEPFPGGTDLQGRLGACRNGAHLSLHHLLPISYPAAINLPRGAAPREVSRSAAAPAAAARPAPAGAAPRAAPQQQQQGPPKAVPAVAEALALARKAAAPAAPAPQQPGGGGKADGNALVALLQRAAIKQQASGAPPPQRPAPQPAQPLPVPVPGPAPPGMRAAHQQQGTTPPAGATPPGMGMPPFPPGAGPRGMPPQAGPEDPAQAAPPVPKFLLQRAQQRQAAKAVPTPRMPDGTRGFGVGRGRPDPAGPQLPPAAPGAVATPRGTAPGAGAPTTPPASPGNMAGMALLAALQNGAATPAAAPAPGPYPQPQQQQQQQQQPRPQQQQQQQRRPVPVPVHAKPPPQQQPPQQQQGGGGFNAGQMLLNQLQRGPAQPGATPPRQQQPPAPSPPTSPYVQHAGGVPPPGMPAPQAGITAGRQLLASLTAAKPQPRQQPPPQQQQQPPMPAAAMDEQAMLLQLLRGPPAAARPPPPQQQQPPYAPQQRPPPEPYRPGNMGPPPGWQPSPAAAAAPLAAPPPGLNPGALLLSRLQKPADS